MLPKYSKIQTVDIRIKCLTITGNKFIQYVNNIYDEHCKLKTLVFNLQPKS
jgi:hypothetical protein